MVRLDPDARRAAIVASVVDLAQEKGLLHLNHADVADRCVVSTSEGTVRRYFHTINDLRHAAIDASETVREEAARLGLTP